MEANKIIKQKHVIGILLAFVMVCATMSIVVDDVSAAKKYKKLGTPYKFTSGDEMYKVTAYTKGKTVKINSKQYVKNKKTNKWVRTGTTNLYLTKVSTTRLKIVEKSKEKCRSHGYHAHTDVEYKKTKLSAKQYYKKHYRNPMM